MATPAMVWGARLAFHLVMAARDPFPGVFSIERRALACLVVVPLENEDEQTATKRWPSLCCRLLVFIFEWNHNKTS